jgi:DNA modification methylase
MLFLDDCRDVLPNLLENTYDLIIVDAPFGKCTNAKWDKNTFKMSNIIDELYRVLTPQGSLYVHCGMGEKSNSLIDWFLDFKKNKKFHFKDTITWQKNRGIGMRKGWLQTSEQILWFVKDNKNFRWNKEEQYSDEKRPFNVVKKGGQMVNKSEYKRYTNIWKINEIGFGTSPANFRKIKSQISHLTPKHPFLSDRMINLHCDKNSKVLIPFAGSGMEILSCEWNNLIYDAIEIEKENIDFICKKQIIFSDFIKKG